jgi:hypothetical protein
MSRLKGPPPGRDPVAVIFARGRNHTRQPDVGSVSTSWVAHHRTGSLED